MDSIATKKAQLAKSAKPRKTKDLRQLVRALASKAKRRGPATQRKTRPRNKKKIFPKSK
ncbi:hypothetical protein ACFL3E_01880 [Patescibacteria group bacterium]